MAKQDASPVIPRSSGGGPGAGMQAMSCGPGIQPASASMSDRRRLPRSAAFWSGIRAPSTCAFRGYALAGRKMQRRRPGRGKILISEKKRPLGLTIFHGSLTCLAPLSEPCSHLGRDLCILGGLESKRVSLMRLVCVVSSACVGGSWTSKPLTPVFRRDASASCLASVS